MRALTILESEIRGSERPSPGAVSTDLGISLAEYIRRRGVRRVASFDDDFAVYRFGRGRRERFTVVR